MNCCRSSPSWRARLLRCSTELWTVTTWRPAGPWRDSKSCSATCSEERPSQCPETSWAETGTWRRLVAAAVVDGVAGVERELPDTEASVPDWMNKLIRRWRWSERLERSWTTKCWTTPAAAPSPRWVASCTRTRELECWDAACSPAPEVSGVGRPAEAPCGHRSWS